MASILHLSDLHFGRADPAVTRALLECAARLAPDVVAVSGDVTQRARRSEFTAARRFLDSIPAPRLVVPGNHDVPLHDLVTRFFRPHWRYRRWFDPEPEPVFLDRAMVMVGVNTARAMTIKGGRINREQVRRASGLFCQAGDERTRVLVTHHPFDLPPGAGTRDIVGRAGMAMAAFGDCLPDLLLAGHRHVAGAFTTAARYRVGARGAIVVQAGTATSTRVRGERNSFNLIHVAGDRIAVDRFDWAPARGRFDFVATRGFVRRGRAWEDAQTAQV